MAATIINVNAVEESISRSLKYVSEQEDALSRIDGIVHNMEDAWESPAQRAYADSFRQSKAEIEEFNESVKQSISTMREFVDACVSDDELTAREILRVTW